MGFGVRGGTDGRLGVVVGGGGGSAPGTAPTHLVYLMRMRRPQANVGTQPVDDEYDFPAPDDAPTHSYHPP